MHDESHESGDTDSDDYDDDDRQWARLVIRRRGKQRCCDEALTAMAATMATIVTRLLCLEMWILRGALVPRDCMSPGDRSENYRCWWMATMLVRVMMLAMLAMMATIGVKCSNSDSIAWRGFGHQ